MTHSFVGAAIAKAGADRATPLATTTLVVAANAPDVDILSYAGGPYFALAFRRGLTHGWPALLLLPFLVASAILAWDRWVRRRRTPDADPVRAGPTLLLAGVGVATHPTLDWMNSYGMRWALPFDGSWSYGDALFIIDPWIWLALGGALYLTSSPGRAGRTAWLALAVLATLLVLVGMPAAAPGWLVGVCLVVWLRRRGLTSSPAGRRRMAGSVLTGVALYVVTLVALDGVAVADVRRAAEAESLAPRDVMVAPRRGRLFQSVVEVRTDAGYVPGTHRWLASPRVELRPRDLVALVAGPAGVSESALEDIVARAREVDDARHYLVWSRYPYVRVEAQQGGWRVRFADARYDDDEPGTETLDGVEVMVPESAEP